jgi:hypothetical protein
MQTYLISAVWEGLALCHHLIFGPEKGRIHWMLSKTPLVAQSSLHSVAPWTDLARHFHFLFWRPTRRGGGSRALLGLLLGFFLACFHLLLHRSHALAAHHPQSLKAKRQVCTRCYDSLDFAGSHTDFLACTVFNLGYVPPGS